MEVKIYAGQKLLTTTKEYVTIVKIEGNDILVSYKGKIYKRSKSIIGKKLFIVERDTVKPPNEVPATYFKPAPKRACYDCMEMRRGDCFGQKRPCEFFRPAPSVSREEVNNWPKYGDATYYRLKGFRK